MHRFHRILRPLTLAIACIGASSFARADAPTQFPSSPSGDSAAPAATLEQQAPSRHANPRLKASFRGFSIANLDTTPVWLEGAQLDLYPLSRRFVRLGIELEGGAGNATLDGHTASLSYGLAGMGFGFQYPGRVTPFIEARFAAGVLAGSTAGPITVATNPNTTISNANVATYMYIGGIDAGFELYAWNRVYLSAAVGWARPTWHGVDYTAMKSDPSGGMKFKDITNDTFTFKIGIGI